MSTIVTSAVLLYSILCVNEITANCPWECICERTFTICKEPRTFIGSPTPLTPPTIDLNVAEVLPGGALPANLNEVNLQNGPIKLIAEDAFDDSAYTITSISLINCLLTRIPDALNHLHILNYLNIADTNILDWNIDVLTSIGPSVTALSLSSVGLKIWPSWMTFFTNVTSLTFGGSAVSSIPDDAFDLMKKLTNLNLDGNKLSAAPKAISRIATLQTLDISDNVLSDITWLPTSSPLISLSLNGNKLSNSTHISNALLPYVKSLNDIYLRGNQLTSIPDLYFLTYDYTLDVSNNLLSNIKTATFPPKLNELDLSSNIFSLIPSFISTLQFVATLSMSSNHVTTIRSTDFATCIIYVQLDRNLITELTDTSFPQNSSIVSMLLDYNPLMKISKFALKNLVSLAYLSLQNSQLARLPMALASLTKLNSLDMNDNRYLVCTCMEKDLAHWVLSTFSEWSLNGNCGQTSIYFFFQTLTPGCPVV